MKTTAHAHYIPTGGFALVVALVVVAVLTALVTEFAYGVYMDTVSLGNLEASERLSLSALSGAELAGDIAIAQITTQSYTYPGVLGIPMGELFEGSDESLFIVIEDENSKFNINTIVHPNGLTNPEALASFKRLLRNLSMDEDAADWAADWIDPDHDPRLSGSEEGSKNSPMDSPDEILLIPGMGKDAYEKLRPHITVWGDGLININGAGAPALMSLSDSIDRRMAERVVEMRAITPFESAASLSKVAGFETLGISLLGRVTVKSSSFRIISNASSDGIRRTLQCVMAPSGRIDYWMEL